LLIRVIVCTSSVAKDVPKMTPAEKSPSKFNRSASTSAPEAVVFGNSGAFLPNDFLTTPELARALKVSDRAPENWRLQGIGPKFIRAGGRRILYRWGDVLEYLDSRRFSSTSEESNAA
jgi:hypothetical protein